ncbi:MAG: hypothetical protein Q8P07_00380 [bacterium]|nr:hypothetical protein [bacterium]
MKTFILAIFAFMAVSAYSKASFADEVVILRGFEYEILRNDNLYHLAKRFNTTKAKLLAANTDSRCIKNENLILKGCKLNVPSLYPAAEVENLSRANNENIVRLRPANIALTKSNSKLSFLLSGVGLIAGFLFVGLLVIMVRTAAFKDRMEKTLEEKRAVMREKETALKGLELWRNGAVNQINDLKTKLSLKTEELSLQEGSQEEIKRLKAENDSLVLKLNEYMTELDRTRFERGALYVELAAKITAGDNVSVLSKENGRIDLKVLKVELESGAPEVYVECTAKEPECLSNKNHDLKWKNALGHLNVHGTSQNLKPNGWYE